MASLATLIRARQTISGNESNLQPGEIYFFNPGTLTGDFTPGTDQVWSPPRDGRLTVEVWGAGGSAGKMCCCGNGVPGNPGAYSRKTFSSVTTSDVFTMSLGQSCGNDAICYKGVSEPTTLSWTVSSAGTGTICSQGGNGGFSACVPGSAGTFCCVASLGQLCGFPLNSGQPAPLSGGAGCGRVCNYRSDVVGGCIATACGGDINLNGGFSCTTFYHCNACCMCSFVHHVRVSPGMFSQCGSVINVQMECGDGYSQVSGNGIHQLLQGLSSLSRSPISGMPSSQCWAGRSCNCYEITLCQPFLPHGVPGIPSTPCSSVRDYGFRGGHGAIRFTLE